MCTAEMVESHRKLSMYSIKNKRVNIHSTLSISLHFTPSLRELQSNVFIYNLPILAIYPFRCELHKLLQIILEAFDFIVDFLVEVFGDIDMTFEIFRYNLIYTLDRSMLESRM